MVATRRDMRAALLADAVEQGAATMIDADDGFAPDPGPADGIAAASFRHAFRQLAATVAVLTVVGRDGRPRGMTVTSMCGLSVEPPTLLVCIDRAARTHRDLMASGWFGLDILAEHQHAIAARCARTGSEKILAADWLAEPSADGLPHLAGSVVRLGCSIDAIHPASTHDIVVGRVRTIDVDARPDEPLLYHDGRFGRLGEDRIPLALADTLAHRDED
jgi:flavin reductase (DIM6/NTAB) family NADH-FMN oxidoreductase RutF